MFGLAPNTDGHKCSWGMNGPNQSTEEQRQAAWSRNSMRKAGSVFTDSDLNIDTSTLNNFNDLIAGCIEGFLSDPNTGSPCSTTIDAVFA